MNHHAHGSHGDASRSGRAAPAGLQVTENGLRLVARETHAPTERSFDFEFVIEGEHGIVTDFDIVHDRRVHLILVRRDLSRFQHVHPKLDGGSWHALIAPLSPGVWRAFADFSTGGRPSTLGVDLHVRGEYVPEPLPAPTEMGTVDGMIVTMERDGTEHVFAIQRDGAPVEPESYLGARGHLVAVRDGDLAFLHVHPLAERLAFVVPYPSPGRYRLFLQFSLGAVHLAGFSVDAEG